MARSVDVGKLAEWRGRLERFRQAGISVTRFCRGEQVSVPSFYQWRRKLAAGSARHNDRLHAVEAFAPVRLVGTASVAAWLPGGTRIEIPIGDSQALQLALHTLVRADAEGAADLDAPRASGVNTQAASGLVGRRGGAAC
jgi:hypothetical protein